MLTTNRIVPPPGSVLIIENDNTLRGILVELLGYSDVPCLDTPSGYEGVQLYEYHKNNIDLVIMDMGLADTNGASVVQELEALCPDVKVVIISGQEKKRLDLQFETHPNVSVVQKPFKTFEFLDMVNGQLFMNRELSQVS